MKKIRIAQDIFKERERREREEAKKQAVEDIKDIFSQLKPKKTKKKFSFLKWGGIAFFLLFLVTLIVGCIWLIKLFIIGIIT